MCRRGARQPFPLDVEPRGQAGRGSRLHRGPAGWRCPQTRPHLGAAPLRSLPSGSQRGMAAFDPICF